MKNDIYFLNLQSETVQIKIGLFLPAWEKTQHKIQNTLGANETDHENSSGSERRSSINGNVGGCMKRREVGEQRQWWGEMVSNGASQLRGNEGDKGRDVFVVVVT